MIRDKQIYIILTEIKRELHLILQDVSAEEIDDSCTVNWCVIEQTTEDSVRQTTLVIQQNDSVFI